MSAMRSPRRDLIPHRSASTWSPARARTLVSIGAGHRGERVNIRCVVLYTDGGTRSRPSSEAPLPDDDETSPRMKIFQLCN